MNHFMTNQNSFGYKERRLMKKVLTGLIASSILVSGVANAESDKENKGNEDWDKPIFIQGADLEGNDLEETEKELNVKDDYETYKVSVDDVSNYVPSSSNLSYIYSSATIEKKSFRNGVDVEIDTPENITKVTTEQYRNAALTAGIQKADIHIASIESVTGEGALAGIYKAYEEKGNSLDQNDIQSANEELTDISNISEENEGKDGYSDEALNASIADIKKELADIRNKQDEQLTQTQVEDTVNKVMDERGLSETLNDNQKQIVTKNMTNVANSKALNENPKEYYKNAKSVTKDIQGYASDKLDQAKDKAKQLDNEENKNILNKFIDGIKSIIDGMISFIQNVLDFFSNLFK